MEASHLSWIISVVLENRNLWFWSITFLRAQHLLAPFSCWHSEAATFSPFLLEQIPPCYCFYEGLDCKRIRNCATVWALFSSLSLSLWFPCSLLPFSLSFFPSYLFSPFTSLALPSSPSHLSPPSLPPPVPPPPFLSLDVEFFSIKYVLIRYPTDQAR